MKECTCANSYDVLKQGKSMHFLPLLRGNKFSSPFCQCDDGINLLFKHFICVFWPYWLPAYIQFSQVSSCSCYQNETYLQKNVPFPKNIPLVWTPLTVKFISIFQVYILNVFAEYIWSFYCNNCKWPFSQYLHIKNSKGESFKVGFLTPNILMSWSTVWNFIKSPVH